MELETYKVMNNFQGCHHLASVLNNNALFKKTKFRTNSKQMVPSLQVVSNGKRRKTVPPSPHPISGIWGGGGVLIT